MIAVIRHKGLRRLYENDDARGVPAAYADKLRRILFALDTAVSPPGVDLPGFGLHEMSSNYAGFWSIVVSRNWRVVFRFEDSGVTDVDFVDYH